MADVMHSIELPPAIASRLAHLRRRARCVHVARGAVWGTAVLLGGMAVVMFIDWAVVLSSPAWRVALSGVVWLAAMAVFVRFGLYPLLRPYSLAAVALDVDRAVPALEERWSTVAELAASTDPPSVRGGPILFSRVIREAEAGQGQVVAEQIFPASDVKRWLMVLAGGVLVGLVALAFSPRVVGLLAARFWLPMRAISLTSVQAVTGDTVAARGEPLTLKADFAGRRPRRASLSIRQNNREDRLPLTVPSRSQQLALELPNPLESFSYRFTAGDGTTHWHDVVVTDRPGLAEVAFRIVPPDYSHLPDDARSALPGHVRALAGSRLELALRPTKPLSALVLDGIAPSPPLLKAAEDGSYCYATGLEDDLAFSVRLTDIFGLGNLAPARCHISVYEDAPPSVRITSPQSEIALRPDDALSISFEAGDDFGIASAELIVVHPDGDGKNVVDVIPIPLDEMEGARQVAARAALDLKSFALQNGQKLEYSVRVTDTRCMAATETGTVRAGSPTPDAPRDEAAPSSADRPEAAMSARSAPPTRDGQTCSATQTIRIDPSAGTFEDQARRKLEIDIDGYLAVLETSLRAADEQLGGLRPTVVPDAPWNVIKAGQLRAARDHLAEADTSVGRLRRLSTGTPYAFMGLQLVEIVDSHVTPARDALGDAAGVTDAPARQRPLLDEAALHVELALARLSDSVEKYEMAKKEHRAGELAREAVRMHEIFVEDMQQLLTLKEGQPWLNPRTGQMLEVSDAYREELREYYEQLKVLLDELARVLADDPDLLRRMMARTRMEGVTLRDQLTVLAYRQQEIEQRVSAWADTESAEADRLRNAWLDLLAVEQEDLVQAASDLYENTETWIPRDVDRQSGALAEARQLSRRIALESRPLRVPRTAGKMEAYVRQGRALVEALGQYQEQVVRAMDTSAGHAPLVRFVGNRIAETDRLKAVLDAHLRKVEAAHANRFADLAVVQQRQLVHDTAELGAKLERTAPMLGPVTSPTGAQAHALVAMVSAQIPGDQQRAVELLTRAAREPASQVEGELVEAFAEAERDFDALLDLVEEAALEKGPPDKPCKLPSLEKLLESLEQECKACEKLGALVQLNVTTNFDWPGSGIGGSGGGKGGGSGRGRQGQRAQQGDLERDRRDRTARARIRTALAETGRNMHVEVSAPPLRAEQEGREWNVLVSRLEDELRHGRDRVPPEHYRTAIDRYFEAVSQIVTDRPYEQSPP